MQKKTIMPGAIDVVFGLQWGDEGKGKWVDYLSYSGNYDIVARFQGGPNAGHTLYTPTGKKFITHQIPSGVFHENIKLLCGSHVAINPIILLNEIIGLQNLGYHVIDRLYICQRSILITPFSVMQDKAEEIVSGKDVGSTQNGIANSYKERKARTGLLMGDIFTMEDITTDSKYIQYRTDMVKYLNRMYLADNLEIMEKEDLTMEKIEAYEKEWLESIQTLKKMNLQVVDIQPIIFDCIGSGKNILAEGAQGGMLDNTHGDYKYVTSSNTLPGEVSVSLGIPPQLIRNIYGVVKSYTTKVGGGPFPSKFANEEMESAYQEMGAEKGATTGRLRNCGGFDMPVFRKFVQMSGVTHIIITKTDICPYDLIEIVDHYLIKGEKQIFPPLHLSDVKNVERRYMKSWKEMRSGVQDILSLPIELINFASYLKNEANIYSLLPDVKIYALGTGHNREDCVLYEE